MGDINTNIRIDELEKVVGGNSGYIAELLYDLEQAQKKLPNVISISYHGNQYAGEYTGISIQTFFSDMYTKKKTCTMYLTDSDNSVTYQLNDWYILSNTHFISFIRTDVNKHIEFDFEKTGSKWYLVVTVTPSA